jgi:hypothetical protein
MKTRTFLIIFIPGLAAVIGLAVMNGSAPPPEPLPRNVGACFAAQLAVKERIAEPSRAKFPSCLNGAGVKQERPESTERYVVNSYFETPDSSGIYRSHTYQATVVEEGKNSRVFILGIQ